jgi:large subunit ribosomal protein L21
MRLAVYAVLVTGGKQYKAQIGQVLTIEKLEVPTGEEVRFDQVLLINDDQQVTVGTPVIGGASVTGKVVRHDRGPKIIVFKYKPKVRYRRKTGHRQEQTHVLVQSIRASDGAILGEVTQTSSSAAPATIIEATAEE